MEDNKEQLYFAAKKPEECASALLSKAQTFYNIMLSNSYLDKIVRMYNAYYGVYNRDSYNSGSSHAITFTGEQGELVQLPVNHFRNLAQHILVMITANRPSMEARAVNTDYKSLAQTYLANGILDYYMREKRLEDILKKAVEMAIVMGCGFVKMEWNATAGEAYDIDPDSGEFNYEGEIEFTNLSPFDVVVDGTKESWDNEWILVRSFQNRHNLIAKYPELKEQILSIPTKVEGSSYRLKFFSNDETDDIPVYEFYHKRTEAMPHGRYLLFLDSNTVLLDTKMPYRQIPIFRIAANEIMGTPYGYSPMFDVYPLQESINALYSIIMTNNNAFGTQNLFVPNGANLQFHNLEGALNVIEGNAKPEPLQLTQTAPETYEFLKFMIESAQTLSGVNSVARGAPEASLKSGTALALVQSMALQFVSGLQHSYVKLVENVGTSLISILKDFATTPKVVALVGKNNRPLLKEFTGEDINAIERVIVDLGNPLARSTAGKVQIAEQLLQMGLLKTPQQYIQIINTGKLESSYEGEMSELLLIKAENEKLMVGEQVLVTPLDQHRQHVLEHRSVISDPDLRNDPVLVKNVLDHIQEHIDYLKNTPPEMLALIGEEPIMAPPPPMPPGGDMGQNQDVLTAPGSEPLTTGETIVGPGGSEARMPSPANVPAELLPNPELQAQSLGNVK
jgi:hypothetical protein